jgi:predicted transcriptional regulator YdeE
MDDRRVEMLERDEVKLVGFSIVASLNNVLETQIGGKLRKELDNRKLEVEGRVGDGMYLIQIYPTDGHWTPDVPYQHVFAYEVRTLDDKLDGMVMYTLPAGRYNRVIHEGAESRIGETYDYINRTLGPRPIDIEYWSDIHSLEEEHSRIEIYVPAMG